MTEMRLMETLFDRGQTSPCQRRASKRLADHDEPSQDQPITKRLARMKIGDQYPTGRYPIPSPKRSRTPPNPSPRLPNTPGSRARAANTLSPVQNADDRMLVDDTRDRVYIHDLESEIAAIEAAESPSVFLGDIDKKISAIPAHLLQNGDNNKNNNNTQMVLYHVPASLSVPEEHDHVRKAILAARTRTKEKQEREAEEQIFLSAAHGTGEENRFEQGNGYGDDFDEMDLG